MMGTIQMVTDENGEPTEELLACILQTIAASGMYGAGSSFTSDLADQLKTEEGVIEDAAVLLEEEYEWFEYENNELRAPRNMAMEEAKAIRADFWDS